MIFNLFDVQSFVEIRLQELLDQKFSIVTERYFIFF